MKRVAAAYPLFETRGEGATCQGSFKCKAPSLRGKPMQSHQHHPTRIKSGLFRRKARERSCDSVGIDELSHTHGKRASSAMKTEELHQVEN